MLSSENTKVQYNSDKLKKEMAPGQGVQLAASIDNNSDSATPIIKKDESTRTEEVKGDISNQAAAKKDHPSRLTTDVDALFKALEDNKVIFRNSESKEKLKKAFKEAKDYDSLIKRAGSKRVEIYINAFRYKGFNRHISESLIKSCEESVTKAVEIADKYFGGGRSDYYTKSKDNKLNILSVFLASDVSEPTKINDLLKKEKGIDKLRVYRLGKKEVVVSRSKKDDINIRNYNFKEVQAMK